MVWMFNSAGRATLVGLADHRRDPGSGSKKQATLEERGLIGGAATPAGWGSTNRRQKDMDATWTKRYGKSFFGAKFSMKSEGRCKLIGNVVTYAGFLYDDQHIYALIDRGYISLDVYADQGCPSQARESDLTVIGYRSWIQRKGTSKCKPSECEQRRNHRFDHARSCRTCSSGDCAHGQQIDPNSQS